MLIAILIGNLCGFSVYGLLDGSHWEYFIPVSILCSIVGALFASSGE